MKIVFLALLITTTAQAKNPNSLWGECKPTPHVKQEFTLQGTELNLQGTPFTLNVENDRVLLLKGDEECVLGDIEIHFGEGFDLNACDNASLTGFSERFILNSNIDVKRRDKMGICKPQLSGLIYTGYTVEWYKKGSSTFNIQCPFGKVTLNGKRQEWYRTLKECVNLN